MSDEQVPRCARCGVDMEEAEIAGVPVDRCPDRHGILVEQRKLIPLTEGLAKALGDSIDPDEPIEVVAAHDGDAACPDCDGKMTSFGYMGTRLVSLNRCSGCSLIWVDENAIEPMIRLCARTIGRARAQEAELAELERHMSAMVWSTGDTSGFNSDLLLSRSAREASQKIKSPSKY